MIDIKALDKTKTHLGYEIGTGIISKLIQDVCSRDKSVKIPKREIASHCFGLAYNGNWYVYEAHLKHKGCKKFLLSEWLKSQDNSKLHAFPYGLNISSLEFYSNPAFNPGYSCAAITGLAIESISDKDFWNNNPGFTCSEYMANCSTGFDICYKYSLNTFRIKPVHFQLLERETNDKN